MWVAIRPKSTRLKLRKAEMKKPLAIASGSLLMEREINMGFRITLTLTVGWAQACKAVNSIRATFTRPIRLDRFLSSRCNHRL